jgi:hypothetical protein
MGVWIVAGAIVIGGVSIGELFRDGRVGGHS